jgi:hypothetical protein
MPDCCTDWFDEAWWVKEISTVIALPHPTLCNLRITLAHYQLSLALQAVTGTDAGANFHTWAVWGSKKAGQTIRQEDTRPLRRAINLAGSGCGLGIVAASGFGLTLLSPLASIGLGCLLGLGPSLSLKALLHHTTRQILAGNQTVLDDIGVATGRFVATFYGHASPEPERLEGFIQTLRPGKSETGGQELLSRAFVQYYQARYERDLDKKHECMFLANCYAILHEHIRLEPYIRNAMLKPLRRWITANLLDFYLGGETFRIGKDIPPVEGESFPDSLKDLDNPELLAFLYGMEGWDRTPDNLAASRATDWSDLRDRMNFIVDLFRSRHLNPKLFNAPYTTEQTLAMLEGRVPAGPL